MVEFRKYFTNFIISIILYSIDNLAFENWFMFMLLKSLTLQHILAKRTSYEIYMYNPWEGGRGARNISTKKCEIQYFKIKIIPFIIFSGVVSWVDKTIPLTQSS